MKITTTNTVSQNQLHTCNCHLATKIFIGIYYEQY